MSATAFLDRCMQRASTPR